MIVTKSRYERKMRQLNDVLDEHLERLYALEAAHQRLLTHLGLVEHTTPKRTAIVVLPMREDNATSDGTVGACKP